MQVRFLLGAFNMQRIEKFYMSEALKEAQKAFEEDEVPVGSVIVHDGRIVARGHNQIERLKDPTAHAEIIAITSAANYLGTKWLNEAWIVAIPEVTPLSDFFFVFTLFLTA